MSAFDEDGKKTGVVFETATPFDTPRLMSELVEWVRKALIRQCLDAADEIAGHGMFKITRADHDVHSRGELGEKHRGLTGGIAATDGGRYLP